MNMISFKQFIYTFNFRYYDDTKRSEYDKEDSLIIRIYYCFEDFNYKDCWFEFGIYDFGNKDTTWKDCCKFLSKDILNSYVECIRFNPEENNVVNIWLTKEKEFCGS